MITIKELYGLTNVSRKQINNRVNKIKWKYPQLIKGGGKGKGGKYSVNNLFMNYLTRLNPNQPTPSEGTGIVSKRCIIDYSELFNSIDWNWFGCLSTTSLFETEKLFQLLHLQDGEILFYSIHSTGKLDKLHIHFTSNSELPKSRQIKQHEGLIINTLIKEFRNPLKRECYDYFTNFRNSTNRNQIIVDYGFLIGYSEKKQHKILRLV